MGLNGKEIVAETDKALPAGFRHGIVLDVIFLHIRIQVGKIPVVEYLVVKLLNQLSVCHVVTSISLICDIIIKEKRK